MTTVSCSRNISTKYSSPSVIFSKWKIRDVFSNLQNKRYTFKIFKIIHISGYITSNMMWRDHNVKHGHGHIWLWKWQNFEICHLRRRIWAILEIMISPYHALCYIRRAMENFEQIWKFWRYILYFWYLENIVHIFQNLEKLRYILISWKWNMTLGAVYKIEIIFEAYLSFVFDGRTEYAPFSL